MTFLSRPHTGSFAGVVLFLFALAASALADPEDLLKRAARSDGKVEAWEELSEETRFDTLRAGLYSEDDLVAVFAAEQLDADRLTLDEQRRAGAVAANHPERYFGPNGDPKRLPLSLIGVHEVARIWEAVVERGIDFEPAKGKSLITHRPTAPEHLPLLVSLLPRARPATFRWLAEILATGADGIDRHRVEVARGLLYALARDAAESAGRKLPDPKSIVVRPGGSGLPEAFVTLAAEAWRLDLHGPKRREDGGFELPDRWIARWSRDLTPSATDLPFLALAARKGHLELHRVAAIRLLGKLDGEEAVKLLVELAAGESLPATFAAAELARRGRPERFLELCAAGEVEFPLMCEAAPGFVLARIEAKSDPWDLARLADAHELGEFEARWGVPRPDALITLVVAMTLGDPKGDPLDVAGLLMHCPWLLTESAEDRLLARLREWRPADGEWMTWQDPDPEEPALEQELGEVCGAELQLTLGVLEVRRPKELRDLLASWEKAESPLLKGLARLVRARTDGPPDVDPEILRRIRFSLPDDNETTDEAIVRYRELMAEGRPREAILTIAEDDPELLGEDLALLALHPDARLVALLRRLRAERRQYWPATFALAIARDAEARAEALGFIRDGRTWMLDRLNLPTALTCGADPEFVAHWVDRLEACCCQSWPSCWILGVAFPQTDVPEIIRGELVAQRRVRRILGPVAGRYARSRILGAWVPLR